MAIIGKWVKATAMLEVNQKQQALRQKYIIGQNDNTGFGDNEIVGNDWRTRKPYGIAKRESNGVTEVRLNQFS